MKKNFGRFSRTESGEIQVSLEEVQGELYLDVRITSRPASDGEGSQEDRITVPVRMLADLCDILQQTKDAY